MDDYSRTVRQNNEVFDDNVLAQLGIYVYALQDPQSNRIFYVGKGGGKFGNARVLSHFHEAEKWLKGGSPQKKMSNKIRSILDIWKRPQAVKWFIVRRNLLTPAEAFHIEAALIATLAVSGNGSADNDQDGRYLAQHGLLTSTDVAAHKAVPVNPSEPFPAVLILPVEKALKQGRKPYDAVRSYWSFGREVRDKPCIAVGLKNGISRVVVKVSKWDKAGPKNKHWAFTGKELLESPLLNKNFFRVIAAGPFWLRGKPLGVQFDGKGGFNFFWGAKDKGAKHRCLPDE